MAKKTTEVKPPKVEKQTKASASVTAKKKAAPNTTTSTTKSKATVKKTTTAPKKKAAAKKAPVKKPAVKKPAVKKTSAANSKVTVTVRSDIAPYKATKDEEYMGKDQRDHFTDLLNAWKGELMQEVDRTVNHMKDEAANFPDPADRATQEEEFSLELRTRDRERKLIKKIESTLERIDQDDYGYCDSCGIEIGIERLEARLTATQCIDCKTLDEIKEKQERG